MSYLRQRYDMRSQAGVGIPVQKLPDEVKLPFASFKGGFFASDNEGDVPEGFSPDCLDVMVDTKDRLCRMPGLTAIENVAPRDPKGLFSHASIDKTTELVMFDSPYMGRKTGVAATVWTNVGLPTGDNWVATNHGGVLVFTNGRTAVYSRESLADAITDLGWPGPVVALASFAGRVFGGGITDGAIYNPMGMYWTGATGLEGDVGAASGEELLLADVAEGDSIVALRTIGDDILAILCRKSIWIGERTGDPYRPANFRPRVPGLGCVSDPTARNTPRGVVFLSDAGVEIFDGNGYTHLSEAIDSEIIPIDYSQLDAYGATFSPITQEYLLYTPDRTWRYSMRYNRWMPSSARIQRGVTLFNPAVVGSGLGLPAGWDIYWSGSWDSVIDTSNSVLSDLILLSDSTLSMEDDSTETYLGLAQDAYWWTSRVDFDGPSSAFTIKSLLFDFGGDAEISVYYKDDKDIERLYATFDLVRFFKFVKTMEPAQFKLQFNSGNPKLKKAFLVGIPTGGNKKQETL